MLSDDEPLFLEVQHFSQWWVKALAGALFLVGIWMVVVTTTLHHATGRVVLIVEGAVVGLLIPALIVSASLTTRVDKAGLSIRFRPFHLRPKRIDLSQLADVQAITYRPVADYGGWGIHYSFSKRVGRGKTYNVSGNRGVKLTFANGRHLLIGSQRPEELAAAILQWWDQSRDQSAERWAQTT